MNLKTLLTISLFALLASMPIMNVSAWSNGGYSTSSADVKYGTHDWIVQHALDWLPTQERQHILENFAEYLYGTELPDKSQTSGGIGDTTKHHIYYTVDGTLGDDSAAARANAEYSNALNLLRAEKFSEASRTAGIMCHYIADMAVFGHVMGSDTNWGAEAHHSDYETYVNERTSNYSAEFSSYLSFDGNLTAISAYDAAKSLAYDTTFDVDGDLTCAWMDQHYNWSDETFKTRCGESLNLAVNYIADVLHTLHVESQQGMNIWPYIPYIASAIIVLMIAILYAAKPKRKMRR